MKVDFTIFYYQVRSTTTRHLPFHTILGGSGYIVENPVVIYYVEK